ncbi:MAG: 3-isopropylmalate dehydratase small subunit [Syntrophales bacterium]
MLLNGKAHIFGNDVNTDDIIASKYKSSTTDMLEMSKYLMGNVDPDFVRRIAPGDFIVAGSNFGCGSSRETAPRVIKLAGLSAVLATGFARIFFRNAINVGLPVVECDTSGIQEGDQLEVDLSAGLVRNITRGTEIKVAPLPPVMLELLNDGGLSEHFKKHRTFHLQSIKEGK